MVFALAVDSTLSESHQLTSDDVIVLLNSGTSCAVSNNELDFEYIQPIQDLELKGIVSGLKVEGIGHVIWTFLDEFGNNTPIRLTCLYVPGAPARLLCLSSLVKTRVQQMEPGSERVIMQKPFTMVPA